MKMCIVPKHSAQDKSVSMSIQRKKMMKAARDVWNAKRTATFRKLVLWTKNRQISCMAAMAHVDFTKETSCDDENEKPSGF